MVCYVQYPMMTLNTSVVQQIIWLRNSKNYSQQSADIIIISEQASMEILSGFHRQQSESGLPILINTVITPLPFHWIGLTTAYSSQHNFSCYNKIMIFQLVSLFFVLAVATGLPGYDLPVFPQGVSRSYDPNSQIPMVVWMTMKNPSNTSILHKRTLHNNADCTFQILNDDQMDKFMLTYFPNTSILWAYNVINSKLMAAKADIWRIAALWLNGGVYIDADSSIRVRFSTIAKLTDRFIFGTEKNDYGQCYDPSYRLNHTNSAIFAKRGQVINWLLLSVPKHPFLTQTLYNIVDTVKFEYLGKTFLHPSALVHPINYITCTTGPGVLTASMSEVLAGNSTLGSVRTIMDTKPNSRQLYRWTGKEFGTYNGQWRANNNILFGSANAPMSFYSDQPHYFHVLKNGGKLLNQYDDNNNNNNNVKS